jgi:hypothetical protein
MTSGLAAREPTDAATRSPAERATWPVWIWLSLGVVVLLTQTWVWTRFLASGPQELARYRDPASATYLWAKIFEVSLGLMFLATVGLTVRAAVKARRFTTNSKLLIAFASIIWLDPMLNYLRPGFYFTQNFINVESWAGYLPGQIAPQVNLSPVPYLWVATAYLGYFLPVILVNVAVMRGVAARFPGVRLPVLMAAGYAVSLPMDLGLEGFALRTHTFAYPAASHTWSLWGGQTYQFPVIEMIAAPMFWVSVATIIHRTDVDGYLPFERGAELVRPGRRRDLARILATIGVVNVLYVVLPLGLPQIGVMYTDPFPSDYSQDLHGGWCGDEGQPYGPCPAPGVAWKTRGPDGVDPPAAEVFSTNRYYLGHPPK